MKNINRFRPTTTDFGPQTFQMCKSIRNKRENLSKKVDTSLCGDLMTLENCRLKKGVLRINRRFLLKIVGQFLRDEWFMKFFSTYFYQVCWKACHEMKQQKFWTRNVTPTLFNFQVSVFKKELELLSATNVSASFPDR